MSKLVLHIGTHKTGTTAIQRTLAFNRGLLQRRGIIYPRFVIASSRQGSAARQLWVSSRSRLAQIGVVSAALDGSVGHHGLLSPWGDPPEDLITVATPETLWAKLSQSHAGSSRTVILSSEEFSRSHAGRNGKGPDLTKIREMVAPFGKIQIACFLRHQISFLQSLYLEVSKIFIPPEPANLCAQAIRSGYGAGMFMDFNLLHDRLSAAFPNDQLSFIDYAQAAQSPEGVTGTLLVATGHGEVADRLLLPSDGRANVSQPPLAVWAANQITEPKLPRPNLLNLVKDILRDHFGPNPATTIFSRDERTRMAAHFKPLNQAFETQVAADHPAGTAPFRLSDPADNQLIYREDLNAPFWDDLNRAITQEVS